MQSKNVRIAAAVLAIVAVGALAWRMGTSRLTTYRFETNWTRGHAFIEQGSWVEAAEALEAALTSMRRIGPTDPRYVDVLLRRADVHEALGLYTDAYALYTEAVQRMRERHGAKSAEVAAMLYEMGRVQERLGQIQNATGLYRQAVVVWQETGHADNPGIAPTLIGLGRTLSAVEEYPEARIFYEWALGIRRRELGSDNPALAPLQRELAVTLRATGHDELADRFDAHSDQLEARAKSTD